MKKDTPKAELPRTHRWRRTDAPPPRPRDEVIALLPVLVPPDAPAPAADVEEAVTRALAGWPIVHLRLVGTVVEAGNVGNLRGRWLRGQILRAADSLCRCRGEVCDHAQCPSTRLLGPHERDGKLAGHPWAPWALRPGETHNNKVKQGEAVRCDLVFAGEEATVLVGELAAALLDYDPPVGEPSILWKHSRAMVQVGGELCWRNLDPGPPPRLALDELEEPRTRSGRLTLSFAAPAIVSRRGELGVAWASLPLLIDRATRTLSTWMQSTHHHGPPLPLDDLLRYAAAASVQADNVVPGRLPAGVIDRHSMPGEDVATWGGAATWTGDFVALGALLRAASHVGVGPGRHHGLGELSVL